jgi:hypothetical protein
MERRHGITQETSKNLFIDSGEVRLNYVDSSNVGTLLGATRDGNQFIITQDIRDIPVDGSKGKVKGLRRIIRVDAQIIANFIELNTTMLEKALPGTDAVGYPSAPARVADQITRALEIQAGLAGESRDDYIGNIAIVGEISGTDEPVVCMIKNALGDGNVEITTTDNDEAGLSITFSAHFDPSDLDTEPWEIRYPKVNVES